jgi:hypothetical protein
MRRGFVDAAMRRRKIDYRKDNSRNSTCWFNEPMAQKVYPGKKFVDGIKKSEKRRWGSEPGKIL